MAKVGIDRATLSDMFSRFVGLGDDLTSSQIMRISLAVAKVIDENNGRLAQDLERAGIKLKGLD